MNKYKLENIDYALNETVCPFFESFRFEISPIVVVCATVDDKSVRVSNELC
jgi:hypothetical protein